MIVTVEEAKTKMCQYGGFCEANSRMAWRWVDFATQNKAENVAVVFCPELLAETEGEAGERTPEVGADWVFQPWRELPDGTTQSARWVSQSARDIEPRGYCGLAGKPEA